MSTLRTTLRDLVPVPPEGATMGQWAAYLFQTCPGTWRDVADALGTSLESAQNNARRWSKTHDVRWPLLRTLPTGSNRAEDALSGA